VTEFRAETSAEAHLGYEYAWKSNTETDSESETETGRPNTDSWEERGWSGNTTLWSLKDGTLTLADETSRVPNGLSLIELVPPSQASASTYPQGFSAAVFLADVFGRSRRVRAGIPREEVHRTEMFFKTVKTPVGSRRWNAVAPRLRQRLANPFATIIRWSEENKDYFDEFVGLGRRIKLFDKIEVAFFKSQGVPDAEAEELASVVVDGVNSGLLSDGTLRVVEILYHLLVMNKQALLLVEEPETGIHPGLLKSLLNVIDSYAIDRQMVFSTHSPVVVDHVKPRELRLVERLAGKTSIRRLKDEEAARISKYLEADGLLSDVVYSGVLGDG
jgi:hypothetical protein